LYICVTNDSDLVILEDNDDNKEL